MLDIFRLAKEQHEKGHDCLVVWYYEEDDESVMELGQPLSVYPETSV
jgi:Domain of unknown function (DUF1987).